VAQRVGRGIALLFHDSDTRRGEWSAARPSRTLPPGKDPVPIAQEAGWAPGPVWTGAENLAPTGIRSPDRPVRSQSLCRLSYQSHTIGSTISNYFILGKSHLSSANVVGIITVRFKLKYLNNAS
jgi:hypothetical protein